MGNNGKDIDIKVVVQTIKDMGQFMSNTNQILADLGIRIHNLEVDIEKLKKKNEKRIICPT